MATSRRNNKTARPGVRDIWNSRLYAGAEWTSLDNPKVPPYGGSIPKAVICWKTARQIHRQRLASGDRNYHVRAYVHCFADDHKFDGEREGIWKRWEFFLEVLSHFDGVLGIDFSTCADMPEPLKRYQFHRMRTLEHAAASRGIGVIPNARWGTRETWDYCFDALPSNSMLSIGAVASGLRRLECRPPFEGGLRELVQRKLPSALIVVGSASHPLFSELSASGIQVVQFDSETNVRLGKRGGFNV